MATVYNDRVRETTTTTGTGTVTLAGAVSKFQSFDDGFNSGDEISVEFVSGTIWQTAICTFTSPDQLAIDSILQSSKSDNSQISLVGTTTVFCTIPAARVLDSANNLSELASADTARTNLGLGTIATEAEANYILANGTRAFSGKQTIDNLGIGSVSGETLLLTSEQTDGATKKGIVLNTTNALTTTDAQIAVIQAAGVDVLSIDAFDKGAAQDYGVVAPNFMAIGADAALPINAEFPILKVAGTINTPLGAEAAALEFLVIQDGTNFAARPVGLLAKTQMNDIGSNGRPSCIISRLVHNDSATALLNAVSVLGSVDSLSGSAGLGEVAIFKTEANFVGGKPTKVIGFHAQNLGVAVGITDAIGIQIDKQGSAATNNYPLWFNGDDAGAVFGVSKDAQVVWDTTGDDNLTLDPQFAAAGHYVKFNAPKTTTGDPIGVEGLFYWNTIDNVAKLYADGAWRTLTSW